MENITPRLVHPDQVGFIKGRHGADAMRKTLAIMEHSRGEVGRQALLSVYSEKAAFDQVEWEFLWAILKNMGFKERFISGIRTLDKAPKGRVVVNGKV